MFKDELVISVKAGDGGRGCISFHREKFQPKGGPDGGRGGKGGSVFIRASSHLNTLYHLTHRPRYCAQNGAAGGPNNCTGKSGDDLILDVPAGTIIRDATHRNILKDLKEINQMVMVARGGKGGRGNRAFATSTNQTPTYAEPGETGEERCLYLELKLIADVGLVGLPNAGKSLLLRKISSATPKVADYPFTTLEPHLGIIRGPAYRTLVVADLPGLIEGAHQGKGLGDKFLRHIERTRLVAHLIDFSGTDPLRDYRIIRKELVSYSMTLGRKPQIIIANKMDLAEARKNYQKYAHRFKPKPLPISALTKFGLTDLLKKLFGKLK